MEWEKLVVDLTLSSPHTTRRKVEKKYTKVVSSPYISYDAELSADFSHEKFINHLI